MYAIICIFDFTNFMSFIIKFIKFKPIIKFKKFELHNYGGNDCVSYVLSYDQDGGVGELPTRWWQYKTNKT